MKKLFKRIRKKVLNLITNDEVTGVILCGGHSSRMGFNKALLQLNGEYVLLKTAARLRQLLPKVVLMTDDRQNFNVSRKFSAWPIWEDEYHDVGPLGGLTTALKRVETPYIFIMACDIPNLSLAAVTQLLNAGTTEQIILYRQQGRIESLFGLYQRSCLSLFEAQLTLGIGQIRYNFSSMNVKLLDDSPTELCNINTPAELPGWRTKKIMR